MIIVIIILAVALSAFFSSSETAFVSSSRLKIEVYSRRGMHGRHLVHRFLSDPDNFIITTLLGNNIANVTYSSMAALFLAGYFSDISVVAISSIFILIFGEIIPKAIAYEFASRLIFRIAYPFRSFEIIFMPFIWVLNKISKLLLHMFRGKETNQLNFLTRKDMEGIILEGERVGVLREDERKVVFRLLELQETTLKDTMVPRTDIIAISSGATIDEVRELFISSGHSKIPVYEKDIDNIIGIVLAKDLFKFPRLLDEIITQVKHYPETKPAFDLLQEFQSTHTSLAIVMDEYGGTAGLVTIEDLVEELFGEIYDEYDLDQEKQYVDLGDGAYLINARAEIDELNDKFGLKIKEGDYTTLGGFILNELGHIPKPGERLESRHCDCTMEITRASRKRVQEVKVMKRGEEKESL
ncbi:HlyC/CorC family transporter [candidate division KSB1 bacterium]|nr:HlyC/CorC family transporter [candidate division KSB1 bacterium]